MNYYKFYELYTEYGTLFVYEKYKEDKSSFPETREFFTNNKAQIEYDQLCFNNGKSVFKTRKRNSDGYVREDYMKELEPHEFLDKVEPFLSSLEEKSKMVDRTKKIFESIQGKCTGKVIIPPNPVSLEEKNNLAILSLKKYIK